MRIVFYLLVGGAAAVVTFALTLVIWKLSTRYRLYPKIRERDVHTRPTPRLGGIAMFIGIVVAFAVASQLPQFDIVFSVPGRILAILGAALMIVALGILRVPAPNSGKPSSRQSGRSRATRAIVGTTSTVRT